MSLAHAVLTSLIEKSSSGYDLARRFDKSIGYFWHATHQQIYRELARMEAAGWIESSSAPDAGKTRKREYRVLEAGRVGEVYNVGGWNEKPNLDIVHTVCALLDELKPRTDGKPYQDQITYVTDRPGHDRRYAIDARKIEQQLGWKPAETFETGIRKTVQWYLDNPDWVGNVLSGGYKDWVSQQYGDPKNAI